jgi:tetraprenyl-beta-curcumene synthase
VRLQLNRRWELAGAFTVAAGRYWLTVLPVAQRELRCLRRRASGIPDLTLRRLALDVYGSDWASLEGVAAFAAFARPGQRATIVRLLVGLQSIYQYTDTLMEQPCASDPAANASRLHNAILIALQPGRPHADYYAHNAQAQDGGFLIGLVDRCRATLAELPSYQVVEEAVLDQARRIVHYQSDINLAAQRDHPDLARWAELEAPAGVEHRWWELAAASGSSLAALALLSAAGDSSLTTKRAHAIEGLYWPWMGALHTLLDSLIDRAEDAATGQHNLLDQYSSRAEMAERLEYLAVESARRAEAVGVEHRLILAGMTSLYLSDPNAWLPYARDASERVLAALGGLAKPAMLVLRARRLTHRDRRPSSSQGPLSGMTANIRSRISARGILPQRTCRTCRRASKSQAATEDNHAGQVFPEKRGAAVFGGVGHGPACMCEFCSCLRLYQR